MISHGKYCLSVAFFVAICVTPQAQLVRTINWDMFPDTGVVEGNEMKLYGGFDYAQRGFGNGPESNHNEAFNLSLLEDVAGVNSGRWAKVLSRKWPGPNTVHTFGKSIRATNLGLATPFSYDEIWIDVPLWIPEEWITHSQGKLGYSLSNPFGTPPGTNPTDSFEFLFHYFSCNTGKLNNATAPWYSVNPEGPFEEQDMLIGLDVYGNDDRINTHFSEPVFFRENVGSEIRKVFSKNTHYVLRAHIKLNSPGEQNGILEGWYSEDGGLTWTKSVEVLDFDWRGTRDFNFEQEGFVAFRGGNGHGFEVGGDSSFSQNTGLYNPPQDAWYFIGKVDLFDKDPFSMVNTIPANDGTSGHLIVRPNPSNGYFQIFSDNFEFDEDSMAIVHTLGGRMVAQTKITPGGALNLTHLLTGHYIMSILDDRVVVSRAIIEIIH